MGTKATLQYKHGWMMHKFNLSKTKIIDKQKFIANFMMDCTATGDTARKILKMYELSGKIKVTKYEILVQN